MPWFEVKGSSNGIHILLGSFIRERGQMPKINVSLPSLQHRELGSLDLIPDLCRNQVLCVSEEFCATSVTEVVSKRLATLISYC